MTGRQHYVEAERLVVAAGRYTEGSPEETSLLAKATVHALLARAGEGPGRQVDREWCNECDGSGYAPRVKAAA